MINIKELSVGNWVYNKHHGKAIQITPFDFFTHTHNKEGKQRLVGNPNIVSGKDFEPILITPAILEKNRFQKTVDEDSNTECYRYYRSAADGYVEIILQDGGAGDWAIRIKNYDKFNDNEVVYNNNLIFLKVHQLQNALTLCGIDINIEFSM